MVTIEQKLSLFSKLLQQDIKTEIGEKIEAMEKEYEVIMTEQKRKINKDTDNIIEHARKKAEIKRLEFFMLKKTPFLGLEANKKAAASGIQAATII